MYHSDPSSVAGINALIVGQTGDCRGNGTDQSDPDCGICSVGKVIATRCRFQGIETNSGGPRADWKVRQRCV
jgi:hypothetical protein